MAFFHLYLQTSFLYFYFHVKVTDSFGIKEKQETAKDFLLE